jgi:hypothetical protein
LSGFGATQLKNAPEQNITGYIYMQELIKNKSEIKIRYGK